MLKLLSWIKGVPGTIGALLLAVIVFQLYVHAKEKAAVERAQWHSLLDSLAAAHRADSAAAALRDSIRVDSIRHWQAEAARAKHQATAAATHFANVEEVMRSAIDSADTAEQAAFDTLIAAHKAEVTQWQRAVAYADSIHSLDSLRIVDRDLMISHLRSDLADMTQRADKWQRAANHGWLTDVFKHPVTHAVFALGGYVLGKAGP